MDIAISGISLLKMLGVSVNRDGLAQVFTWLPAVQKAAAQQLWQRLEQKAERCKAYNDKKRRAVDSPV